MSTVIVVTADLQGDPADMIRAFKDAERSSSQFADQSDNDSRRTKSAWDGMKSAAIGFASGLAVYFSAQAIVNFTNDVITAAGDLQQSIGGVDAVFDTSSSKVNAWAANAADAVGLSQNSYNQLATVIGAQLTNAGFSLDDAADKTNNLIGMSADLAATFGGTTADAVSSLSAAFRGEYDSIEKYGLSIKESTIQSRLAEQGLSDLTGEAYNQARALELMKMLSEQTAGAQGMFASEVDTLQGQQQRLTAEFENQQAALGTALLPAMTELVGMARDILPGAFSVLGSVLAGIISVISDLASYYQDNASWINVLATTVGVLTAAWLIYRGVAAGIAAVQLAITAATYGTQGAMLVTGAATAIYNGIMNAMKVATVVATAVQWAWNAALTANPIGVIIMLIAALVAGIIWFFTQTELGQQIWSNFMTWLQEAWTNVSAFFTALWTTIVEIFTTAWNAIVDFLTPVIEFIASFIRTYVEIYINIFLVLAAVLKTVWEAIVNAVEWAWNGIVSFLTPIIDGIASFIIGVFTAVSSWWNATWSAISSFVQSVWSAIIAFIVPIILQIQSNITNAVTTIQGIWNSIWSAISSFFASIWNGMIAAVQGPVNTIFGIIGGIQGTIMGFFSGIGSWLYSMGTDLIQGFINGITSMVSSVIGAVSNVVNGAIDWAKGVLGIASPSKVFMQIGMDTGEGVVVGLDKMQRDVIKASMSIIPQVPDPKSLTAEWTGSGSAYGIPPWMEGASAGSGGSSTSNQFNIEIKVERSEGDDADDIAEKVSAKLQFALGGEVGPTS